MEFQNIVEVFVSGHTVLKKWYFKNICMSVDRTFKPLDLFFPNLHKTCISDQGTCILDQDIGTINYFKSEPFYIKKYMFVTKNCCKDLDKVFLK